jgi:putative membrane protein
LDKHDHPHGGLGPTGDGPWWSLSQWDVLIAAALLAAYLLSARHSRRRDGGLDGQAPLAWALGLAAMFVAASSPFAFLRESSHLGYMAQLELLMSLAPPLLLLGLRPAWGFCLNLKERRFVGALWRIISMPALTLGVWLAIIYAWHLPTLHMLGMHSRVLYTIQLSSYVVAGLLFWWPVIAPAGDEAGMRPLGKLGYLALAQAGAGLLAAILIFYPRVIYAHGLVTEPFGLSALADQKLSGVAMMVVDMMVASTVAGWIALRGLANMDWRESLSLSASYRRRSASRGWTLGAPLAVILVGCGLILGSAPASQFSGAAPANDTPAGNVRANAASNII